MRISFEAHGGVCLSRRYTDHELDDEMIDSLRKGCLAYLRKFQTGTVADISDWLKSKARDSLLWGCFLLAVLAQRCSLSAGHGADTSRGRAGPRQQ